MAREFAWRILEVSNKVVILSILLLLFSLSRGFAEQIGDRIVYYAKKFIGTPYDPDPLGAYVRERKIVFDSEVDCMYLTFRSVELAFADGDEKIALDIALDRRFKTRGFISNGVVLNYNDRFEYGEDMFLSGKWGKIITNYQTEKVFSERLGEYILFIPKTHYGKVKYLVPNGSIIFFVKDPKNRLKDEVVGHLGILEKTGKELYLIHASGSKNKGGKVVREKLGRYLSRSKNIGFVITHF
ncbi:MAG: hypothetical protein RMJ37_04530 [Spirochaetia bacterium]|nr:DUF1460 domain-containing protein [Spirochaetota bacterium]MCX8095880.1 DUF1460 domain-containing protein [Spirochaetota bacterium]MDW8112593.1 hypothetical protein [Spirochaetia bacterium]